VVRERALSNESENVRLADYERRRGEAFVEPIAARTAKLFPGGLADHATQMPDVAPGSTPVAFGDFSKAYTIVERKARTMQIDPYSAGFCGIFKFEARVGGATTCPNAAKLLRIR